MTAFARAVLPTTTVMVQSADPTDLQNKVNAAILAAPQSTVITDITLAGAGDGHTFVVLIEFASNAVGSPLFADAGTVVRCYLAGEAEALLAAKTAAGTPGVLFNLSDEQLAGSSKGTRFMGMSVFSSTSTPASAPPYAIVNRTTPSAAALGPYNVIFDNGVAPGLNQFSFTPPSDTVVYTGPVALLGNLDASLTVTAAAGSIVQLTFVNDPSGANTLIGAPVDVVLLAGGFENVSMIGVAALSPTNSLPNRSFGIRINGTTAVVVERATFRITPV